MDLSFYVINLEYSGNNQRAMTVTSLAI